MAYGKLKLLIYKYYFLIIRGGRIMMYKTYDEMTVTERYKLHRGLYLVGYYDKKTGKKYWKVE